MKDQQARELLSLLLEYVDTYPTDTDKLTVSELADDLAMSMTNGREDAATVAAMIKSNRQWQWYLYGSFTDLEDDTLIFEEVDRVLVDRYGVSLYKYDAFGRAHFEVIKGQLRRES